ncbi:NAD(+)/NADH kinase [Helicovermis profundi]|uniref:NAD kinase n=1 Tax=Helicovermis profundi TaxID=3065157 RepID=A0AAU9EQ89_9FIRM|nr:NAD kinase [Clostridia bacterium S502]
MKNIMLFNNNRKASLKTKEQLKGILIKNGFNIVTEKANLIIVIGGDGTMLSAIRKHRYKNTPFLGINTGSLGFLPSISPNEIEKIISILKNKDYKIMSYPLLEVKGVTVKGNKLFHYAFNEILIKHLDPTIMEAKIYINGKPFNYFTGDGFIISTPIGATGYAIWAGGVATHSELPVYQITPLNPNDNSINRPLKTSMIVPVDTLLDIKIVKDKYRAVIVACDGRKVSNDYISELHISASHKAIKILRWGEYDYFDLYKNKIIDKNISKIIF